ncbi:hypothetical protein AVANS14531_04160 [Campylobacter sp. Cr9]|uniref:hypothetical protein n=1 Tax=Campylobacter sp. Cr9 TaxID=2735728 RepID=UPI0030149EBD|nr:hypothetical protein [Campylobacter sp. Cr9]
MKLDLIYIFLANMRITFLGVNNSFDFKAKLIACVIGVVKEERQDLKRTLEKLTKEIYKKEFRRRIFLATIYQYVKLIKQDTLGVDKILKGIKKLTKQNPKLKRKINFVQLDRLVLKKSIKEGESEIEDYAQIRVLEFLKNEVI